MTLTPLELPGWIEFNVWRTALKVHRFSASVGDPRADVIFYLDRQGRVKLPPNNPYLSVSFQSARQSPTGRTAEWLRAAATLVDEMKRRGVANLVILPPDVDDVRPWQWRGFRVGVRYTYCIEFPFNRALMERGQRQNGARAARLGMTVERVGNDDPIVECLTETEERKRFSLGIGDRELRAAYSLLGADSLRMYACFDGKGRVAASCVVLHVPGARAIAWLAGTRTASMASGAGHLLWPLVFDDLSSAGAIGIDLCGANIESVADFKSRWGSRLAPTYTVRTYSARAGARFLADWLGSRRRRVEDGPMLTPSRTGSRTR